MLSGEADLQLRLLRIARAAAKSARTGAVAAAFLLACRADPAIDAGSTLAPRAAREPEEAESEPGLDPALDPSAFARAAVVLASCATPVAADQELARMYERRHAPGSPEDRGRLVRCLDARRSGCQAIDDCLAMTTGPGGPPTACRQNVAETSFGDTLVRVDCARLGRTCVVLGAIAECIEPTGALCPNAGPSATLARCTADGTPARCRGGYEALGLPCAQIGLACAGDGVTHCAGTGEPCPSVEANPAWADYRGESCAGEGLRACVGGRTAVVACGAFVPGSSCQTGSNGRAYCGRGTECSPGQPVTARCDGDAVTVCNGGVIERVDCRALGFTRCLSDRVAALGAPHAACAP